MRSVALLAMVVLAVTCGPSPDAKLPGYAVGTGGDNSPGSGGVSSTGGTTLVGTGGRTGTGGSTVAASGGATGTGGRSSTGGATGTGGRSGTGGVTGTGGRMVTDAGPDGRGPDGRIVGSGGTTTSSGGAMTIDAGRGGGGGAGGATGTGGATGRDAAISTGDASSNCFSTVVSNGYTCGNIPPCSECKDQNGNSREAGCMKAIDCLAAAGASCNSSCKQDCLNLAGDTPGMACVTAFQTACSGSGC
jgi:hypothetical protein